MLGYEGRPHFKCRTLEEGEGRLSLDATELFLSLFKGRPDLEEGEREREAECGESVSGGLKRKVSLSGSLTLVRDSETASGTKFDLDLSPF